MVFTPAHEDRWSALALHNLTDGKQPLLNVICTFFGASMSTRLLTTTIPFADLPTPEDAARTHFPPSKLARAARHAATNPVLYVHVALALSALPYLWVALLWLLSLMRWVMC